MFDEAAAHIRLNCRGADFYARTISLSFPRKRESILTKVQNGPRVKHGETKSKRRHTRLYIERSDLKKLIVAIDGPSGAGKSTVAKLLADTLGYVYIDTGAMYRAIGWKADRENVEPVEGDALSKLCDTTDVTLGMADGKTTVFVDGIDVTGEIRTPKMSMLASAVSAQPSVRARLLVLQRKMGEAGGVVMDGRDIGTVVFPGAEAKFYLDADVEERARRRHLELTDRGEPAEIGTTLAEMKKRDHDDSSREIAPLKQADDAVYVDTTGMDIGEVVAALEKKLAEVADAEGR